MIGCAFWVDKGDGDNYNDFCEVKEGRFCPRIPREGRGYYPLDPLSRIRDSSPPLKGSLFSRKRTSERTLYKEMLC